ncbi:MAG: glycosyltransferase family 39 protein [Candidatus Curtissbacteria bacterium]
MNKKKSIVFFGIILLAFVLRFYKLGEIPLSLNWDENSNAYNAYSILKTGRDQYGTFLPLTNRSFDDYKPPLYMYLNVPAVAIFGLTPFAARLPSALLGFLTVPIFYFFVKKLTGQEKVALIATFFLAISPWHIQFSRIGFEATVGLFTLLAATATLIYGLQNRKLLIASSILFGLSIYSYHTQRILAPAILLATVLIWRREILSIPKKYLAAFIIIGLLIVLPLAIFTPRNVLLKRLETTTSNAALDDINKSIKFIEQDQAAGLPLAKIINNRRIMIGKTYLSNYISHFDPNFLFIRGDDNFRHHVNNMGMIYLFQLPLLILGVVSLAKYKNKSKYFILALLILSPIAAAPASPSPHAVRSLPMVIALEIISAFGILYLLSIKFRGKILLTMALVCWMTLSVLIYFENYWRHYPYDFASFWQFGYSQAAQQTEKVKGQYDKINIDRTLEQAYIFWLFNTKYDPAHYQQSGSSNHFDKYYFDAKPPASQRELFVSDSKVFPQGFDIIATIQSPEGDSSILIGHPK